jgi:prepilin-type N-terminal cleavage/methylation domain-containing protein/prepilin-type processing-associated H-X9-DG protein
MIHPRQKPTHHPCGFTLIELLVVIAIIGVLVGILLPAMSFAREQSRRAVCLARVRTLSTAVNVYSVDFKTLPDAVQHNLRSGYSPNGRGNPLPVGSPLNESTFGAGARVLPSIGYAIQDYTGEKQENWSCPSAPPINQNIQADGSLLPGYKVRGLVNRGENPLIGMAPTDQWYPNYFYMSTKTYYTSAPPGGPFAAWRPDQWFIRNIAGLPVDRLQTFSGAPPSQVVAFLDEKSLFHQPFKKDVYDLAPGETDNFFGNYAFIDGHAESRKYRTLDGYLGQLHDGIPQVTYGRDFLTLYPDSFTVVYPNE